MGLRIRIGRRGTMVALALAALMVAVAVPVAASGGTGPLAEEEPTTGTLVVKVYGAAGTGMPVAGAEVFLNGTGTPRYACTSVNGVARFRNVPAGIDLTAATGPAVARLCNNPDFRRSDGKKMFWMAYRQKNLGQGGWTTFQVTAGGVTGIVIRPRTPTRQGIVCGGQEVTHFGTARADYIIGSVGDDVINAFGEDDVVWGGGGNDTICGGDGDDILIGDAGNDWLIGDAGDDVLLGTGGNDRLIGNDGADRMVGGTEDDWFWGLGGGPDWAYLRPGSEIVHKPSTEGWTKMLFVAL